MKAWVITPGAGTGARLVVIEAPEPGPDGVLVAVHRVVLDGSDTELVRGEYGKAPPVENELIFGHESLGNVESVGDEESPAFLVKLPPALLARHTGDIKIVVEVAG